MADRKKKLGVESLENRLNLSSLTGVPQAAAPTIASIAMTLHGLGRAPIHLQSAPATPASAVQAFQSLAPAVLISPVTVAEPAAPALSRISRTPIASNGVSLSADASASGVALTWSADAATKTRFEILRSTDGSLFDSLATIFTRANTYTDTRVSPGTTYWYRIVSTRGLGTTPSTATVMVTTPGTSPAATPKSLPATAPAAIAFTTSFTGPDSHPALPATMQPFAAPTLSGGPNAPILATWTRTAAADDTLVINGSAFDQNTQFFIYSQTTATNGKLQPLSVQQLSGTTASVTLPADLPADGMYLLYAKNADGYSKPAAINQAEAWWVGPKDANPGQTVSVYGRNLVTASGTTPSFVYLTQKGSSDGIWAQVTSTNPYKVDFVVPATLSAGSWQVWIHNGRGEDSGWSAPVTMNVAAPQAWTATVFNVKTFGAKGDGAADDTAAIDKALAAAAASPFSTLYFPTGTYMVSRGFVMPSNIRWQGDGKNATSIKLNAAFYNGNKKWDPRSTALIYGEDRNGNLAGDNVEIRDMTLDANHNLKNPIVYSLVYQQFKDNVRYTNVRFNAQGYYGVNFTASRGVFLSNCDFVDDGNEFGTAAQVFISGCNFYGTNDLGGITLRGANEISITNSTMQDLDNSNPNSGAGWSGGRFLVSAGSYGSQSNVYLGNNATVNLAVRAGRADQNSGEQILWEGFNTEFHGNPAAVNGSTLQFTSLPTSLDRTVRLASVGGGHYFATILSGPGIGQYREVLSVNPRTGAVTLAQPFAVAPTTSSVIGIGDLATNVAVYNNNLDGTPQMATGSHVTAATGVQLSGSNVNFAIDSNNIHELRVGVSIWSTIFDDGYYLAPTFSNLIANNVLTTGTSAISFFGAGDGTVAGLRDNVVRNNTITGFLESAFKFSAMGTGTPIDTSIIEHNKVFQSTTALKRPTTYSFFKNLAPVTRTLIYKNAFDATGLTTSIAIIQQSDMGLQLDQNQWLNFKTAATGILPPALK